MARVMTVLRQPAILWHDACKAESKAAFRGMAKVFWLFYAILKFKPFDPLYADRRQSGARKLMDSTFHNICQRMNNRRFAVASNASGLSDASTVFHYHVDGNAITGTYQGGHIRTGHLVGRATGPDTIELLYHCLTTEGELLAGWSRGTVGVDHAGRTTLEFVWGWLSGATGGGESSYVELHA